MSCSDHEQHKHSNSGRHNVRNNPYLRELLLYRGVCEHMVAISRRCLRDCGVVWLLHVLRETGWLSAKRGSPLTMELCLKRRDLGARLALKGPPRLVPAPCWNEPDDVIGARKSSLGKCQRRRRCCRQERSEHVTRFCPPSTIMSQPHLFPIPLLHLGHSSRPPIFLLHRNSTLRLWTIRTNVAGILQCPQYVAAAP